MRYKHIFVFLLVFSTLFIRPISGSCQNAIDGNDSGPGLKEARELMHRNKNDEALSILLRYGSALEKENKQQHDSIINAITNAISSGKNKIETDIAAKEKRVVELKAGNDDIDVANRILTANTILFFSVLLAAVIVILISRFRTLAKANALLAHSKSLLSEMEREVAGLNALIEKVNSEYKYFESAGEELKKADDLLSSFLSDKSHPVYKPAKNLVDKAESVKSVLLHSKMNLEEVEKVETNLNEIIEEVLEQVYYFRKTRTPEFECTVVKDLEKILPRIEVFPDQLRFVLFNLLENAMHSVFLKKSNAPKGYEPTVTISTRKLPRFVQIRIKDNGSGIDSKVQDRIFDPFFSSRNSNRHPGLGLTECKRIITVNHKGELYIESDLSSSTDFIIRFPTLTLM